MSNQVWVGIGGLVLGGAMLGNWWFEMFSDSWYAELCRSFMEEFNLGRNTTALIEPAVGGFLTSGGGLSLAQAAGFEIGGPLTTLFGIGMFLSLAVGIIGLVPFRLPQFMYPEGQMEKRRWRETKQRLQREAEAQRAADATENE